MENDSKPEWARMSVFWAIIRGKLPRYLLGLIFQNGVFDLYLVKRNYVAVRGIVYVLCERGYDEFPQIRESLKNTIEGKIIRLFAMAVVLEENSSNPSKERDSLSTLIINGDILCLIRPTPNESAYRSEYMAMLPQARAKWAAEQEAGRIAAKL